MLARNTLLAGLLSFVLAVLNIAAAAETPTTLNTAAAAVVVESAESRIVGGHIATPHQFPFLFHLEIRLYDGVDVSATYCGASIVSTNYGLTAAHCTTNLLLARGTFGAHHINGTLNGVVEPGSMQLTFGASDFKQHPLYEKAQYKNDISIVHFPSPLVLSSQIQRIKLPHRFQLDSFEGRTATTAGWGVYADLNQPKSDVVRYVDVGVLRNCECANYFGASIQPNILCTSGANKVGACGGDSGGPLFVTDHDSHELRLIGVTSFGVGFGCELSWPTAFTRVTAMLNFITQNTDVVLDTPVLGC